jgi:hypothetical protein
MAAYVARRVIGWDLKAIAKTFGMGYTNMSRRVTEIARRIENDKSSGYRLREIMDFNLKT